uniref:Methyltransferase domain-containing protein n=1 Tax=Cystobacter sp. TaxID=1965334 RepID=UPI0039658D06
STLDFYAQGQGDRLIDPARFPAEIKAFLEGERVLLDSVAEHVELLVEVGSMHGQHLGWAIARGKHYIGVDPVPRYIEQGRRTLREQGLPAERFRFIEGGAEELHQLLPRHALAVPPSRCLLFFPFNSFGNMRDPERVLESLSMTGLPFLISSYATTERATQARAAYYAQCQYEWLESACDERGVRFRAPEGFDAMAYHVEYLEPRMRRYGLEVRPIPFADVGVAWCAGPMFEPWRP